MTTVLIVEDEDSLRATLSAFLARAGHEVLAASDAREALECGVSGRPDVLVTDWMLRDQIHGLHVSEVLTAVNPDLHTILITGFPSKELIAEVQRCGVSQLLEKPFDLKDLHSAVERAVEADGAPVRKSPIPVVEIDREGKIRFASSCARELFRDTAGGVDAERLQEILEPGILGRLERSLGEWIPCALLLPEGSEDGAEERWLMRARASGGEQGGWLVILCPEKERARTADPRVQILLDYRSRSQPILPDHGPVVVIEPNRDLRRLLVSQIERIGALCYPADDLESALKLLSAEPRAQTVLLDFALAGDRLSQWLSAIREIRPAALLIGTGGAGSAGEVAAPGLTRRLPKPWRIVDLLDAMTR